MSAKPGQHSKETCDLFIPKLLLLIEIQQLGNERGAKSPDARNRMTTLGIDLLGGAPQEFEQHIRAEMAKWSDLIRKAGIRAEASQR